MVVGVVPVHIGRSLVAFFQFEASKPYIYLRIEGGLT
jgi:hypothetical protein